MRASDFVTRKRAAATSPLTLDENSRVAVLGGGPAGSLFSYFLLEMAARVDLAPKVDIYEPKQFSKCGPAGCNMCGGIISESLVQLLATEGVNLPPTVVQRGIDSYVLHMDVGSVRIDPPGLERRIAAVHRGAGPRGTVVSRWESFDGHLLSLAQARGAKLIPERVESLEWVDGRPRVSTAKGAPEPYDLLVAAVGVNGRGLKLFEQNSFRYAPPATAKTFICEFPVGAEAIQKYLGNSMHVFLLDIPRLEFGALIPKGDFITTVMLGKDIDNPLAMSFLNTPQVKQCFPPGWSIPADFCRCFPSINVHGAPNPFADRLVFIGDCSENRLYKDGIGGAYRTAKAAAKTVVFAGFAADDFRRHFRPVCRDLAIDNAVGKAIFAFTKLIQRLPPGRKGILRMLRREQAGGAGARRMSGVMWDTFTGSAPYRDVFRRTLHPFFLGRLLADTVAGMFIKGSAAGQGRQN